MSAGISRVDVGGDAPYAIHVGPGLQHDSTLQILIARNYIEQFTIDEITPAPVRTLSRAGFIAFEFARKDTRIPVRIVFEMTPTGYWNEQAEVGIAGATSLTFGQMVLP